MRLEEVPRDSRVPETVMAGPPGMRLVPSICNAPGGLGAEVIAAWGVRLARGMVVDPPRTRPAGPRARGRPEIVAVGWPRVRVCEPQIIVEGLITETVLPAMTGGTGGFGLEGLAVGAVGRAIPCPSTKIEPLLTTMGMLLMVVAL